MRLEQAFRFEVWSGKLILLRELSHQADLEPFQAVDGPGRSSLRLYLDQTQGRAILVSPVGKILADISLPTDEPVPGRGIRLLNKRGNVTLERIRVNRWNGAPPAESLEDRARIQRRDGTERKHLTTQVIMSNCLSVLLSSGMKQTFSAETIMLVRNLAG